MEFDVFFTDLSNHLRFKLVLVIGSIPMLMLKIKFLISEVLNFTPDTIKQSDGYYLYRWIKDGGKWKIINHIIVVNNLLDAGQYHEGKIFHDFKV